MSDEINIQELPIEELFELMQEDLYDGLADEVLEEVNEALARGLQPFEVLTQGLVAGMDIVGKDFRDGTLFVPEVLMAASSMKSGMTVLRPLLIETGAPKMGTAVIGTVKGDIHDIGQNLVSMMWEGAGFEVTNIGINNSVEDYMAAIEAHNPEILGLSALLTTTMPYMKTVIDALNEAGIRERLTVLVGGAPLSDAFAEEIGADAYCRDAAVAVDTAKKFMQIRNEAA
ncbi:MAG: cobalamin-binding protein [Chloroflexi bacterium]|nr:cobalamin-binding protein [Chloroflexota bacterium]